MNHPGQQAECAHRGEVEPGSGRVGVEAFGRHETGGAQRIEQRAVQRAQRALVCAPTMSAAALVRK